MKDQNSMPPALVEIGKRSLLVGVAASLLLISATYAEGGVEQFFRSYLLGYIFWVGVSFGALGILMLHHLVGGRWGFVICRPLEAAIRNLPPMFILFIPILFGMTHLYEWTHSDLVAQDEILQHKTPYLNTPFFIVRSGIYFLVLITFGWLLTTWSRRQDGSGDPALTIKLQKISAPGLVVVGLVMTFAAFDWLMSLEPHWFSTIYGLIVMVGCGLSTIAFMIMIASRIEAEDSWSELLTADRFHDLGNLMLAFTMLWAYLSFSQYLITWMGNLPEDIPWYLNRMAGGWQFVGLALIVLHFSVPFLLLLSRTIKRSVALITALASAVFLLRFLDIYWLIVPAFHPGQLRVHWLDLVAPLAVGGIWIWFFVRHLGSAALVPLRDPRFEEFLAGQEGSHHG